MNDSQFRIHFLCVTHQLHIPFHYFYVFGWCKVRNIFFHILKTFNTSVLERNFCYSSHKYEWSQRQRNNVQNILIFLNYTVFIRLSKIFIFLLISWLFFFESSYHLKLLKVLIPKDILARHAR